LYHCAWSPFDGHTFSSSIDTTILNGRIVFENNQFSIFSPAKRLTFNR
jgi:dihydroorotase